MVSALKANDIQNEADPQVIEKNQSLCVCIHLKLSAQLQKISSSIIKFAHQRKTNYLK